MPSLPKNFAEQVLDLEGEIDFKCELSSVKRLMELYTVAIEYYESVQNAKYLHYKDRLQVLLSRKDVLQLLENPTRVAKPTDAVQRNRRRTEASRKAFSLNLGHVSTSSLMADRSAEKEIAVHNTASSSMLRKLQENIKNQCSSLSKRLHQRRLKNRSMDFSLEQYESRISEVLEWFLERKHELRTKIELDYKEEFEELAGLGELGEAVRKEVHKRMDEEVAVAWADLDKQKKERLAELKKDLASR